MSKTTKPSPKKKQPAAASEAAPHSEEHVQPPTIEYDQLTEIKQDEEEQDFWDFDDEVRDLLDMLQSPYFVGEDEKASATFQILEGIVNEDNSWTTTRELLDRVMTMHAEIVAKVPYESTPRNVIYKFRRIVLDEFMIAVKSFISIADIGSAANFFKLIAMGQEVAGMELPSMPPGADEHDIGAKVKEAVINDLMEYRMELDNIPELIGKRGVDIIMEGDVVMTYAFCPLVARLLREAAQQRSFMLYIVESQPLCYGYLLLEEINDLVGHAINVVIISDCSAATIIEHKVDKVILPVASVLMDGDFKTLAFGSTLATTAALYDKKVYAVAATYQYCPSVVSFANHELDPSLVTKTFMPGVTYGTNKFDHTSAKSIFMVISNSSVRVPSQSSQAITEIYGSQFAKDEHKKRRRMNTNFIFS